MGLTSQSTVSKEKQGENAGKACIIGWRGYNTRWFEEPRIEWGARAGGLRVSGCFNP